MSAQSTKKKRFGSRRRAANQNEKPKADEFEITDSTFIAQPHIPEENTESLNEFASAENVQSEAQPSPELSGNRRKLGSSRRHKRPHVKDSQHDPGEEVEEKIRGKETIETNQMSLTIQPKSQEELSQGTEDDMSATHGVHLYSATSRYYSSEIQNLTTNYAEADLESLIPKSENLHADLDENESSSEVVSDSCIAEEYVQEGNDKSNTLHSEDIRQSAHLVGISELTSSDVFSCQKVDQQLIDQSNTSKMPDEKLSDVDSVTEKDDDTDLSKQDGNLQGNYIVSESHGDSVSMQFYITPEITTEKISPRKNTVGQATISSPKEELPTDEEQNEHFSFSEDRGTPQSEDAMNKVHKQEIKPTEMHEISPDSNIHDATENSEFISGDLLDQTEMSDTHQSLLILKVDDDSPTYQELSSSDSKSHERPTKENFQALEQNNEDCHVYEFKEPPISSKDRVNTALGQVSELGGRVEDDVKPAEQTGHQEKEGLLSDMEESESSLQTLQSEINVPFDSQHQQNYTDFHPLGNRRKLGLSRKNKGRRHVKDSAAESNQESTEDFVGNTKNHEFLQQTEMTLTTETAVQEEINETMLEGKDKFDTAQTEDVSDQVHENANVATLVGSDLHASSTVDQQMIKESNFWEIPDEGLPSVSSAPEKESKEREEDTELLRQDENVQTNYLVSEDIESSVASEITTDKHNPREQTEPESSVEREISSSTKQELPTNEEQNEIFHLSEDKGDHKSEDTVNALHKEEIKPAQMQEMPQIHCSPESVKHEATENSEIIFGNLTDQTEVNDTHQSLLIVKINDDSPTNQEPSSPDSKLDDHTPKEHNSEVLEQKNEDYHVYDTKKPPIRDIDTVDTALNQVSELEGRVEDDVKPAEQTGHQEKDGLFSEMEESESSFQTLQSEINVPFDSQHQQDYTDFHPLGNRRKLGSSRRNKGRHTVKDSAAELLHKHKEEDVERANEAFETTQMFLAIDRTSQEELGQGSRQDVPLITASGYSSGVQSRTTTNYTEADLDFLITKGENLQEDHYERETDVSKVEVLDESAGAKLEGMDKSGTLWRQEVEGAEQSEDAVNKMARLEIKPTEMQVMSQTDYSSERLLHDAAENTEINSENLTERTDVSDTHQSELIVKSAEHHPARQEISNNDRQGEHHIKESNFEDLEQKNNYHVNDTQDLPISDTEKVSIALGQVSELEGRVEDDIRPAEKTGRQEKEGLFSEMEESESSLQTLQSEIKVHFDSQYQQNDSDFNTLGNRRKLGSSRRNKGRRHVKDSAAESNHEPTEGVVGNTSDNEPLETREMTLTSETAVQEEILENMLEGMDRFDTVQTEDVSDQLEENAHVGTLVCVDLHASSTMDQQTTDQSNFREMSNEELPNLSSVPEKESKEREDTELFQQDEGCLLSEDIESFITLNITTDKHNPGEHKDLEYSVEQAILSLPKQELSQNEEQNEIFNLSEVRGGHNIEDAVHIVHKKEDKPTQMQEMPQTDNSSERLTHDATENSEIISGNLTEQPEVSDTHQSELTVKSTDGSPINQDISNPNDKQEEHSIEDNIVMSLEQENEDHYVNDTKEPPIRDIKTVDTALGQVSELGGRVEDDTKPAEQTGHQEKEGLLSDMEESESSLQTLQSEINAPFDSRHQQNYTDFHPLGNRRKLGSSRKNKGRRHIKDSAAESNQESTEDFVGSTKNYEFLQQTEMTLTTEIAVQEEINETMLEGKDKFDTAQTEDVSDQVHENANVGTLVGSDLHASSTVDQQMIKESNFWDIPDEELPNVSSAPEKESKEREEDTELLSQDENVQTNYLVSEDIESSIASEITTDKHNPREQTEPESSVEQEISSSTKQELPTDDEQNEIFSLSEVKGDHKSEDAVNALHKEEIKPAQMQEMPQILSSPESVKHEAKENSEIIFGNLTDQTEVSDTHQSLLIVKINDYSPTNQEPSSPDSKLDDHTPKEHNSEVLEQKNEDYHVYDTKKPPIRDIDTVDTALNQVSELEGRADDDTKPAEQTGHQEKEGLFSEMEESESSFQTLQSEINVPLDSQHQQKDTEFNPLVNRRKLGSSRRNKGRRHVKDSTVELYNESAENVVGNTKNNEPFETTEMSTTSETAVQEKIIETMPEEMHKVDSAQTEDVGDQVEENAHAVALVCVDLNESSIADRQKIEESNFVEILNEELPNVSSEPEKEREEDTELLRQDENVQTNYLVSEDIESSVASEITTDKHNPREQTEPESSVEQEISSSTKQELPTDDEQTEIFSLSEVKGDHKSEDAVNTLHEIENSPTQMQEMHQTDYSTKRMAYYAIENFEVISGNLTDQTEASDTHQSELIVKSADDSPTNQDMLNPDDKQEEHHTKDNNLKALEQKNEDYHDFDTNKPLISDIDRGNTALGQVSELEGRADDDTKPAEQTGRLEKEGLLSEMEESESSLQTQQSEINAPFDSHHQQNYTDFHPLGNRRKLGSSRRNKGRRHVKDSAAESNQESTEDFVGNYKNYEFLQQTEMTLTTEIAVQEEINETMLEGKDKFDTAQTEDVSDQVHENANVGTLVGSDLHASSTVDQQMIKESNFWEIPDEGLPSVSSAPEKESKEREEDTELLSQDENVQTNYLVSEVIESSVASEITTDKHNPREQTEPKSSVEQEISSSTKQDLPTNEEQNEIFNLSEDKGDHKSEDTVNALHKEEIKPAQMQEMPQILCSPESVKHEATENSEIIFGNLTDQTEVSDTHQSLLIVKINDDSPTNQGPSSPDSKLDDHTPKEHNSEVLEQKNEDYHVYDTKKPPIRDIDTVDTALNQVSELEGRADDDTKPAEQTGHQEKEGLFSEMEESESSLKTLQSEINVPLDSQHQQKDTEFNPLVNRRKLGSSRRNKGRRHVKDSTVELYNESAENVVGNTKNNEPFETTEMSTTSETAVQEKIIETMPEEMHKVDSAQTEDVGDQVEENAHAVALVCVDLNESSTADRQKIEESNFVEILNEELPNVSSEPEKEREEDTELLRQDENVQTNYLVSEDIESSVASEITTDKHNPREQTEPESSVEQEISSSTKQELPTDDEQTEIFSLSEVKGDHKSEDAVNTLHEIENNQTQMQEMHQTDYSTKRMAYYAIENFEVISGNLTDQTEASDTHQSELIVKSADDSPTNQDMLNPDDKQEEHHTKDNNFKALEQKNEDYHDFDTNKPLISDIDRGNAALGQVSELEGRADDDTKPAEQTGRLEKEGLLSEMEESESSLQTQQSEINAPFDSQYQQKDTVFKLTGNRRKLGSSRRNKGGQRLKDSAGESYHRPTEDFVGNTTSNEPLETTEMTLTTDTAVQEERNETMLEGKDKFDTVQTEDVRDKVKDAGFDLRSSSTADQQIINQSNFREKPNDKLPNVSSVPKKESKERDADPELLRQDVNLQSNYFVSESHVESGEIEFFITPEKSTEKSSQREHTDIECSVEQAASLSIEKTSANEEQTEPRVRAAHHSEDAVDEVHEEEVKATQMQEMHQTDNSANKETGSSLQAQQSEMNAPLDSHLQDDSQSIKEQTHTGFKPTGNRRKLGSSRRNKGRLHVEDTTKISLIMETTKQEELKEQAGLDFSSTGELGKIRSSVNDDQNTEKMLVEDTILSKNVMDISSIVTTDITSESGKDDFVKRNKEVNDEEDKHMNEPESLSQLTGCDTVKTDLITSPEVSVWKDDSDKQSVSYHDENIMARSIASDVLEQEEALRGQNKETLSCDKEINMQCTNDTRGESLMYERVSGQREDGEQFESHKSKEINVLPEITPAKLFSHKTDAPSDADLEENFRVDVSEESGISSQQAIQEKMHLDDSENLQVGSKQKRRKMGSTRRTQLNRKPEEKRVETNESDLDTDTDMRNLVKMEAAEELQMIEAADVSQNENAKPSISPASHNEQVVNLVKFVQGADVRDSERNADVGVEPQKDDFTATDTVDITSELTGRNSIDVLLSANTEDTNIYVTDESVLSSFEITQRMQNNEERPESVNVTKDQTLKSAEAPVVADLEIVKSVVRGGAVEEHMSTRAGEQEPDNVSEGAHNENLEMNASPNLGSTSRRRKLGSTRKNLGSRTNRVDLHRKHDVDDEATDAATNVGREKTKSSPGIIEDDLQPHTKHKDGGSDERKDTVEYSHTGESQENPDSRGQLVETEHQIPSGDLPAVLSTPPKHDFMSEAASRRKRKLGSHRKSHGHQSYESQTAGGDRTIDAQNEKDVTSITDQSGIRTTEELKRESVGLDKISEVDESDKEPSANISKEGEHSRPASAKPPESETPVQHRFADIRLGQESQKTFSLAGNSEGADLRSNALNVMMIGDSSVGKTSFIKRAQSGKFSLDIPPSIGLDSCKWTVLVDGKPVVLQLWDTAGQERFHSITRQIFHKAQAFLLMYDITSSQSFSAVSYWASCIQEGAAENVTVLLVGNKSDCAERQVKTQEAEILAKEYNFEFTECSAATGENVVQSLETVARMLSQKDDTREEAMVFHKEPQKKKSSRCC